MKNWKLYSIIGVTVIVAYLLWYFLKNRLSTVSLPNNGQGIPTNWTPTATTMAIEDTFGNYYENDDEPKLFAILGELTPDQIAAVYNEYFRLYDEKLEHQFTDHLSGDDLRRALSFLKGII